MDAHTIAIDLAYDLEGRDDIASVSNPAAIYAPIEGASVGEIVGASAIATTQGGMRYTVLVVSLGGED